MNRPLSPEPLPSRTIACCLSSSQASLVLQEALAPEIKESFSIIGEYSSEAYAIITDDIGLIGRAIDEGKILIELKSNMSVEQMVKRTRMRLGLRS